MKRMPSHVLNVVFLHLGALVPYVLAIIGCTVLMWFDGLLPGPGKSLIRPETAVMLLAAPQLAAGILRFVWFSPFDSDDYFAWLRLTPWRPGRPLPFGSPLPDLRDLPLLLPVGLALLHQPNLVWLPFLTFLSGWILPAATAVRFADSRLTAAATAAVAVQPWLVPESLAGGAVAAALLVTMTVVIRRQFPTAVRQLLTCETRPTFMKWMETATLKAVRTGPEKTGWPHSMTGPIRHAAGLSQSAAVLSAFIIAAAIGGITSVAERHGRGPVDISDAVLPLAMFGSMTAFGRIATYLTGIRPGRGLRYRLRTLRLSDPKFDHFLAAPFLSVAALPVISISLSRLRIPGGQSPVLPGSAAIAVGVFSSVWLLLGAGPGLRSFRLTSRCRLKAACTRQSHEPC